MSDVRLEGPIEGDPFLPVAAMDLASAGYTGSEWFVSGEATRYTEAGERSDDGRWQAAPAGTAPFKTRLVVRRPESAERFNGTVIVEWFNVSGGIDAPPDWMFLHRHLMREGAAWVGISVQKAGIDGGGLVPGMPLKQVDAERYGSLDHPGDAYAYGIYSEVARMLRRPEAGPLGPLVPERLIAIGESQSAGFLVTYVNAVDPLVMLFDGFLIHGRPGGAAEIDGRYMRGRPADDADLSNVGEGLIRRHRVREDVRVPVLTVQSETDVVTLGSGRARQPDSRHFRLWEIAGASHFDTYGLVASQVDRDGIAVEALAAQLAPTDKPLGMAADCAVNSGPQQHYVLNAAISHLARWVSEGTPPPQAPRLEASDPDATQLVRDANGIAIGGIRTPWVEAPSAMLSGDAPGGDGFLFLFGKTVPFDADTLAALYPGGAEEHRARFAAATEAAVREGFILEADSAEIDALARHGQQPSGWRIG